MKTRTLLVDANYLLKRSFNGNKNSHTNKFGHIGGLYSFYTTIRSLIGRHLINKIVLMWDGENGGIYRYRIDNNYKANRSGKSWFNKIELSDREIKLEEEKKESILKQRKRIQSYAEELFFRQVEVDEIEADDLIASYCLDNHYVEDIYLFSNDRDFSQLLDLDITILFPNIQTPITKNNFFTEFGYHYKNALTFKIICGDAADNIAGVGGVKEDTLKKYFPNICVMPMMVDDVRKEAIKINEDRLCNKKKPIAALTNIVDKKDRLIKNYQLTNLRKPILNEQAIEELEQLKLPLSPVGRSSNNLYKMMSEDEFLTIYGGTFVSYIEPFYVVITTEKDRYNNFLKRDRNIN